MPNYDSTSRQPFAKGGKVDSKKRTVSSSKTKAFRKAKDKKEDLRFMKIIHEKKFGDRPKLRKKTPLSTVAGYLSTEQRKLGTPQSKTTGVDKRLGAESGGLSFREGGRAGFARGSKGTFEKIGDKISRWKRGKLKTKTKGIEQDKKTGALTHKAPKNWWKTQAGRVESGHMKRTGPAKFNRPFQRMAKELSEGKHASQQIQSYAQLKKKKKAKLKEEKRKKAFDKKHGVS